MPTKTKTAAKYNPTKFASALKKPTTVKELAKRFNVTATAVHDWLERYTTEQKTTLTIKLVRRGARGPMSYAYSTTK